MCAAPCGPSSVNSASEQDLSRDDAHDHVRVRAEGPARPRDMTCAPARHDPRARAPGPLCPRERSRLVDDAQ